MLKSIEACSRKHASIVLLNISLTLPYSEFREEVQGMKPGHARALLTMVAEERQRVASPRKLDYVEPGTPPTTVSIRDNSIETRALAGEFPKFPSNEEDDQRKVHAWFVSVAAWSRVWSLDIANACISMTKCEAHDMDHIGTVLNA